MPSCDKRKITSNVSPETFYDTSKLKAIKDIQTYVLDRSFPCVGAKAALSQDNICFRVYEKLADKATTSTLHLDILEYVRTLDLDDARIRSFVAVFNGELMSSEEHFEGLLWEQLKLLHKMDAGLDLKWNENVSEDPDSPHFSLSLANHPFFVVGMHGKASRNARRTPYPVLVFNSNLQFEKLRADGRYDKMKEIIRKRELEINGSINPMLDDFGDSSEARQYSGKAHPAQWKCPFSTEL